MSETIFSTEEKQEPKQEPLTFEAVKEEVKKPSEILEEATEAQIRGRIYDGFGFCAVGVLAKAYGWNPDRHYVEHGESAELPYKIVQKAIEKMGRSTIEAMRIVEKIYMANDSLYENISFKKIAAGLRMWGL